MGPKATAAAAAVLAHSALEKRVRSGARWFFWIAGLSLVNSLIVLFLYDGSEVMDRVTRVTGTLALTVAHVVDGLAHAGNEAGELTAALKYGALGVDIVLVAVLVALGALSRKRPAAYAVGMVLYGVDAALCGLVQWWQNVGAHVIALFFLWRGLSALRKLRTAAAPAPDVVAH